MSVFGPSATLGIVGGGQLGRMLALVALDWGYRVHVLCQHKDEPAACLAHRCFLADFTDEATLRAFAESCAVMTCEFEHVPATALHVLEAHGLLRPKASVMLCAQNRHAEKQAIQEAGFLVAPWQKVTDEKSARDACQVLGYPSIIKTARMGYDGKGQRRLDNDNDLMASAALWQAGTCIIEKKIDFVCELSVVACGSVAGAPLCYEPSRNVHESHILRRSHVPSGVSVALCQQAQRIARQLVQHLEVVGLLAVEMFVTQDETLWVNELAPRAHNSGHWTMDACVSSQFEQWLRMICGLPSGDVRRLYDVTMQNLLGEEVHRFLDDVSHKEKRVHIYGKTQARAQRKMGHVNVLSKRYP
ncbi:MAG: 5-(carboxyamino)imidazole ribonucleotide synthase [Alphaproteobacteria bacterium GM202ARS2]|nr:5-(carboxyamino)imidazole ribonucleotide synthase [Alphaproteobacteria bacterium GM202ARS2]